MKPTPEQIELAALAIAKVEHAPSWCACMGCAEGEPVCRCKMARCRREAEAALTAIYGAL